MARPPLPAMPLTGGCLCGAVRYAVTSRPLAVNACHCQDCKRSSGGDAGIFLHQKRADFVLEQGEIVHHRKTADSGRLIDIGRCANCGTRMWHEPLAVPELILITAGTLDDPIWAVPTSHIWMKSSNHKAAVAPDALTFEHTAPDRALLWDHFAKLYPD